MEGVQAALETCLHSRPVSSYRDLLPAPQTSFLGCTDGGRAIEPSLDFTSIGTGWWESPQQNSTSGVSTAPRQRRRFLKQRLTFRAGCLHQPGRTPARHLLLHPPMPPVHCHLLRPSCCWLGSIEDDEKNVTFVRPAASAELAQAPVQGQLFPPRFRR